MSPWAAGAICATLMLAATGVTIARGSIASRLVGLQFATCVASVDLLLTAQSFGNSSVFDIALALALLSFPSSLIFARFYARWL